MDKIFLEELAEQVATYFSTNHSIIADKDEKEYEISLAFVSYDITPSGRTSFSHVPNKNTYENIRDTFYNFLEKEEDELCDGLPLIDWSIIISYFDELGIQHVLATIDFNPEGFLCKDGSYKKETFEEMLEDDDIEKS